MLNGNLPEMEKCSSFFVFC